jgi:uncharacterized membrane protein YhaH (DUF805 family)
MNWYLKVVRDNYYNFSGRARRKEYWMFMLFHYLIVFTLVMVFALIAEINATEYEYDSFSFGSVTIIVYLLVTLIPCIAVTVRRLHDTGKSGWLYLLNLIPYIGRFIILIFTCIEGDKKQNKWGGNPKGMSNDYEIDQIGKE